MCDPANRVMLVSTQDEAKWIHSQFFPTIPWPEFFKSDNIVLAHEAREKLAGRPNKEIGIDNLDMVLWSIFGQHIGLATVLGNVNG